MSRKFFTPPQPSPWKGEGVRNSQMMRGLLYMRSELIHSQPAIMLYLFVLTYLVEVERPIIAQTIND